MAANSKSHQLIDPALQGFRRISSEREKKIQTHHLEDHDHDEVLAECRNLMDREAYEEIVALEDQEGLSTNSRNYIAMAYHKLGNPTRAESLYQELLKRTTDKKVWSTVANNLGALYDDRRDFSRATKYFRRSHEADPENQMPVLNLLSRSCVEYDLPSIRKHAEALLSMLTSISSPDRRRKACEFVLNAIHNRKHFATIRDGEGEIGKLRDRITQAAMEGLRT